MNDKPRLPWKRKGGLRSQLDFNPLFRKSSWLIIFPDRAFSTCAFNAFISPTRRMGSWAFSSAVTPASSIMRGSMASIRSHAARPIANRCGYRDRAIFTVRMAVMQGVFTAQLIAITLTAQMLFYADAPVFTQRRFQARFLDDPVPADLLRNCGWIFSDEHSDVFEFHTSLQCLLNVDSIRECQMGMCICHGASFLHGGITLILPELCAREKPVSSIHWKLPLHFRPHGMLV